MGYICLVDFAFVCSEIDKIIRDICTDRMEGLHLLNKDCGKNPGAHSRKKSYKWLSFMPT